MRWPNNSSPFWDIAMFGIVAAVVWGFASNRDLSEVRELLVILVGFAGVLWGRKKLGGTKGE
jgi:hypothetical protein